jgi:DNA-binding CsgD family transcriptional regulator
MNRAELIKLYRVQQRIIEQSNEFYADKPVIKKDDLAVLSKMLKLAEDLFPTHIVLLHSDKSERMYVSENVRNTMQYSPKDITKLSDFEFLENIHPDDVKPVRLAMEEVCKLGNESTYDHTSIRYRINLRYKLESDEYAHISYEAITIEYEGQFADLVLIKNITYEQLFHHVELTVFKRTRAGLVKLIQFIPDQNNKALTPREKDIIRLLDKGFSNQEMATALGISISTVKNHRGKLFRKLQVKSSIQLINYARKESMV